MSEVSSHRASRSPVGAGRAVACFCGHCSRLLYVPATEAPFCPVCSYPVEPSEAELAEQDQRAELIAEETCL